MSFSLRPFAALVDGKIVRFQDDETVAPGETILPVVADADPVLAVDEELTGPDYEVLVDKVRAYGRIVKNALGEMDSAQSLLRAFVLVLLDELNARADHTNAILTAIDNGSNLATVKSNIAAIGDFPQRTVAQLKTAMRAKIP